MDIGKSVQNILNISNETVLLALDQRLKIPLNVTRVTKRILKLNGKPALSWNHDPSIHFLAKNFSIRFSGFEGPRWHKLLGKIKIQSVIDRSLNVLFLTHFISRKKNSKSASRGEGVVIMLKPCSYISENQ